MAGAMLTDQLISAASVPSAKLWQELRNGADAKINIIFLVLLVPLVLGISGRLFAAVVSFSAGYLITAGLCAVFAGFVLAIPSWAMIIGFIVFLLNSSRRIRMEEQYLEKTLNDLPEFKNDNPSLEHLARIICKSVAQQLIDQNLSSISVRLWENEIAWAGYKESF
jgi:protein-S-isoprenylcysteine O-methyltransferase Ste14